MQHSDGPTRIERDQRSADGTAQPLDAAIDALRHPFARAVLEPSSLSERAVRCLERGPADALSLMREVCRVSSLKAEAAVRMADVLFSSRAEFVQLDDDRWALVRDGQVVQASSAGSQISPPVWRGAEQSGPDSAGRHEPENSLRLDQLRFAVVDVETTGSRAGGLDRITEIAIVPVVGTVVQEPWQQLVHPCCSIPPFISALTGITNAMVADAPRFEEIADEVCARLEGSLFVAHNAAFDRRFVDAELSRTRRTRLEGQSLCTVRLARRFLPSLPRRSLDRVCDYFGVHIENRHRAGGDALATAHVLVRLIAIVRDEGIETWPQLQKHMSGAIRRSSRGSRISRKSALPKSTRGAQGDHTA